MEYAVLLCGGGLLIGGYYFMDKYRGSGLTMRLYSIAAYAGAAMIIWMGGNIIDPSVEASFGQMGTYIRLAAQVALFVIAAELLLKPAFEDQIITKTDNLKNYVPGGTLQKKKKVSENRPGKKVRGQSPYQKQSQIKAKNNRKQKKR